jgi:2-iminobutanoate/2-iminopropanoate deaminase
MHRQTIPTALPLALCCALLVSTTAGAQQSKPAAGPQYNAMPSTGGVPLPFSESVRVGETLFISGQIGNLPGTLTLAPGGIGPEARQALDNIKAIVERRGGSMNRVIKCTVFLADIKDWPAFNDVYREYFKTNPPARSALAASGLAFNARTEVDCIAFIPRSAR